MFSINGHELTFLKKCFFYLNQHNCSCLKISRNDIKKNKFIENLDFLKTKYFFNFEYFFKILTTKKSNLAFLAVSPQKKGYIIFHLYLKHYRICFFDVDIEKKKYDTFEIDNFYKLFTNSSNANIQRKRYYSNFLINNEIDYTKIYNLQEIQVLEKIIYERI